MRARPRARIAPTFWDPPSIESGSDPVYMRTYPGQRVRIWGIQGSPTPDPGYTPNPGYTPKYPEIPKMGYFVGQTGKMAKMGYLGYLGSGAGSRGSLWTALSMGYGPTVYRGIPIYPQIPYFGYFGLFGLFGGLPRGYPGEPLLGPLF